MRIDHELQAYGVPFSLPAAFERGERLEYHLVAIVFGVIVGMPIILFGIMRLDERPGRLTWSILVLGAVITFGPAVSAAVAHYLATGKGRYEGR